MNKGEMTVSNRSTKVAVLLATYNGEKNIERQLRSLAVQTYKDFKCYIHDDGSSDNTKKIVDDFARIDKRFVYVDGPSQHGAKGNFMYLLSNVDSDYYLFCDQDDYWHNDKIEKQLYDITHIEEDKPAVSFCDLSVVNSNGDILSESFMKYSGFRTNNISYKNILFKNIAPGCAMIINSKLRNLAIRINNSSNIEMHDWWCMLIATISGNCHFLNEPLIDYYQHEEQQIGASDNKNAIKRIVRNINLILNGSVIKSKKEWLKIVRLQTGELSLIVNDNVDASIIKELSDLSNMDKYNKIQRLSCLFKFNWNNQSPLLWNIIWI